MFESERPPLVDAPQAGPEVVLVAEAVVVEPRVALPRVVLEDDPPWDVVVEPPWLLAFDDWEVLLLSSVAGGRSVTPTIPVHATEAKPHEATDRRPNDRPHEDDERNVAEAR